MNNPKILLTAFKNTSSEKLIYCFDSGFTKLILENNKEYSTHQLFDELNDHKYDYVISFGQKPVIRDKVYIEKKANSNLLTCDTSFDVSQLKSSIENSGLSVKISENAGTSYCNNIYYQGLRYINDIDIDIKMVFIHIPFEKNISDFNAYTSKIIQGIYYYINRS